MKDFYLFDAMVGKKGKLVTSGNYGYIGAPLAGSDSIGGAFTKVNARIKEVDIPNCQHRTDVQQSAMKKYYQLEEWGWLKE